MNNNTAIIYGGNGCEIGVESDFTISYEKSDFEGINKIEAISEIPKIKIKFDRLNNNLLNWLKASEKEATGVTFWNKTGEANGIYQVHFTCDEFKQTVTLELNQKQPLPKTESWPGLILAVDKHQIYPFGQGDIKINNITIPADRTLAEKIINTNITRQKIKGVYKYYYQDQTTFKLKINELATTGSNLTQQLETLKNKMVEFLPHSNNEAVKYKNAYFSMEKKERDGNFDIEIELKLVSELQNLNFVYPPILNLIAKKITAFAGSQICYTYAQNGTPQNPTPQNWIEYTEDMTLENGNYKIVAVVNGVISDAISETIADFTNQIEIENQKPEKPVFTISQKMLSISADSGAEIFYKEKQSKSWLPYQGEINLRSADFQAYARKDYKNSLITELTRYEIDEHRLNATKEESITAAVLTAVTLANTAKNEAVSAAEAKLSEMVGSSPETLNTLNELAIALGNDPNFATTTAANIGKKIDTTAAVEAILTAKSEALSEAATDATTKANNAKTTAEATAGVLAGTAKSEAITAASQDATTKANTAKSEAISAAATDATTKANNAKTAAISAAATDATTKANNAKTTAEATAATLAGTAKSEAITAASQDATTKASTAKSEAISAAASDATTKANNAKTAAEATAATLAETAKSEAITAASQDATTKASTAKTEAISAAASDATTKATAAKSAAEATAATLAGTAKSEAITALNNLQIGGRNLIPMNNLAIWDNLYGWQSEMKYDKNTRTLTYKTINGWAAHRCYINDYAGKQVTISFKHRSTQGSHTLAILKNDDMWQTEDLITSTEWKTYKSTFTAQNSIGFMRWNTDNTTYAQIAEIKELKLELGSKATDWTPAPEDTAAEILTAKSEAISAAASDATTKATAAETTAITALNNLQIGGRNLILNGNCKNSTMLNYGTTNGAVIAFDDTIKYKGNRTIKATNLISFTNLFTVFTENKTIGETYSVSAYIYVTEDTNLIIWCPKFNWETTSEQTYRLTNGWNYIKHTYTLKDDRNYITFFTATTFFNITLIKLEKGTKATDWTPAPEDTSAEILTAKSEAITAANETTAAVAARVDEVEQTTSENSESISSTWNKLVGLEKSVVFSQNKIVFGNQDWIEYVVNSAKTNFYYQAAYNGVLVKGEQTFCINAVMPIEPGSSYRVSVRARSLDGNTVIYCGVDTLNASKLTISTDQATPYNYGAASGATVTGDSTTYTGYFSGYNAPAENNRNKFDGGGCFFRVAICCNKGQATTFRTLIESIEIEKISQSRAVDIIQDDNHNFVSIVEKNRINSTHTRLAELELTVQALQATVATMESTQKG